MATETLVQKYPRAKSEEKKEEFVIYRYGTAGFRCNAVLLESVMLRCGILAALRSLACGGQTIGAVVTASHNLVHDNGVKLVDPSGGMMDQSWEQIATDIANAAAGDVVGILEKLKDIHVSSENKDKIPVVFVGRDTRPTSKAFSDLLISGAKSLGAEVCDFGEVTTPQLHYLVWLKNVKKVDNPKIEDYYLNMSQAFSNCLVTAREAKTVDPYPLDALYVDCANGVGYIGLSGISKHISDNIKLILFNPVGEADVNDNCGAEHVQKSRTFPKGVDSSDLNRRFASVDGDADRLVYFFVDEECNLRLLDGDKIIALFTGFIQTLLKNSGLQELELGIVQTAYANGASTKFIQEILSVPVVCAKTGVKHLHHKALDYDIGVYFEANGHGTVLFSEKALTVIEQRKNTSKSAECLYWVTQLINQAVGDAISDFLFVEVILGSGRLGLKDWDEFYVDLPSRMLKVSVPDRTVVKTTNDERRVLSPPELQEKIDELCNKVEQGRAFVRPSGTEDVVRVYAEAKDQTEADKLAEDVKNLVSKILS